jgi:O-antigen ligase
MISGRTFGELAALTITVAVMGYVAWDGALWDPRFELGLHLAAVALAGGLLWVALAGGRLPRSAMEVPVLLLLLAFGVASLSPWNAGLSAQALAAIIATALVLPAAALAIRHRPTISALAVTLPVLVLAALTLWTLAERRFDWIVAGGPGLPPIRLARESTQFGSVAVAPFVLLELSPIVLLVRPPRLRLAVLVAVAVLAVPLTILSGSRSAWIAIGVAAVVLVAPWAVRRGRPGFGRFLHSPESWTLRRAGLLVLTAAGIVLAAALVAPRLTDLRSLLYRGFLWRDTLVAWSADPLFGIGPGSMPFARQAAAPPLSFPVRQPHSHDIPLGILGDAGLLGLAAAVIVLAAFVWLAGPWRTRTLPGRAAFAVLTGCAVGMVFEDLTFLPGFNLLLMLLAAMALTDGGALRWEPLHPGRWPARLTAMGAVVAAAALLTVMALGDASAIVYRHGTDEAAGRRWPQALAELQTAVSLNPWQPSGPKAVTVAADRAGLPDVARAAAARSVELSPGDGLSWTNLAVLCKEAGDRDCAREAADRAVASATAGGQELANAALVYEWLGNRDAADRVYRLSLLTNPWTGIVLPWDRPVAVGDPSTSELGVDAAELNLLIARRLSGELVRPEEYHSIIVQALAYAMRGDRQRAEAASQLAIHASPEAASAWEVAALLARHYGEDPEPYLRIGEVARGAQLGSGKPGLPGLIYDIATFRAYPADGLVADALRLQPERPWPWVLEPYLAPYARP